mmetsp:Transcript_36522/g.91061  ORF Transcript_36522/g.91061 Transcript_36522/m.91061 type:complete len:265 (-) Transcript_36522:508-1302(-)
MWHPASPTLVLTSSHVDFVLAAEWERRSLPRSVLRVLSLRSRKSEDLVRDSSVRCPVRDSSVRRIEGLDLVEHQLFVQRLRDRLALEVLDDAEPQPYGSTANVSDTFLHAPAGIHVASGNRLLDTDLEVRLAMRRQGVRHSPALVMLLVRQVRRVFAVASARGCVGGAAGPVQTCVQHTADPCSQNAFRYLGVDSICLHSLSGVTDDQCGLRLFRLKFLELCLLARCAEIGHLLNQKVHVSQLYGTEVKGVARELVPGLRERSQ